MGDDIEHLKWIYDRMVFQHHEKENTDYMRRFNKIINKMIGCELRGEQPIRSDKVITHEMMFDLWFKNDIAQTWHKVDKYNPVTKMYGIVNTEMDREYLLSGEYSLYPKEDI